MENLNNKVSIYGEVVSDLKFYHQIYCENFYEIIVSIPRLSGAVDTIPVVISERLIDTKQSLIGKQLYVAGEFRSYNKNTEGKRKCVLYIFASECEVTDVVVTGANCNHIELEGYICKEVYYRKTPLGREIADLMLAVNRPTFEKSDYIPCIVWGRNAKFAKDLSVGTKIKVAGRIQSREYVKKLEDGSSETRVAYEVSVSKVEILEEDANEK